jgi:hypothetical protein
MSTATETRDLFESTVPHIIGAVTLRQGKPHGVAVPPYGRILLTEEEQVLTATGPRDEKDNPLANGKLRVVENADRSGVGRALRPPVEEVATPVEESASAPSGSRPSTEEVGTPDAQRQADVAAAQAEQARAAEAAKAEQAARDRQAAEQKAAADKANEQAAAEKAKADAAAAAAKTQKTE